MWVIEKQILVCFALSLRMVFGRSGKFISKFRGYFKLSFIMVEVDLEGYFMYFHSDRPTDVDYLANLKATVCIFIMVEICNFLENSTEYIL